MLIAVDKVTLENAAQWLEARGDPMQTASELRALVKGAQEVADPELAAQMYRALQTNGGHTHGVHQPQTCAVCVAIEAYLKNRVKESTP